MTVRENLQFPLSLRKISKKAQEEKIHEALSLVEMEQYASRYPHELSGGQQQRVALARTLVYAPSLLLLDEPLSNLDAKLRIRARIWLKELQNRLGITTIYVTHDQIEALSLSDRIAVMDNGKIAQLGTPAEIYRRPATPFVADFIGASNFLRGKVVKFSEKKAVISMDDGSTLNAIAPCELTVGADAKVAIRPEHIEILPAGVADHQRNTVTVNLKSRDYLGARFQYLTEMAGQELRVESESDTQDSEFSVAFAADDCIAFAETA